MMTEDEALALAADSLDFDEVLEEEQAAAEELEALEGRAHAKAADAREAALRAPRPGEEAAAVDKLAVVKRARAELLRFFRLQKKALEVMEQAVRAKVGVRALYEELARNKAAAAQLESEAAAAMRQLAANQAREAQWRDQSWRDWGNVLRADLPGPVLANVAEKVAAGGSRRVNGRTLMAIVCKGWGEALKQDAIAAAGGPEAWRDWGNAFEEGLPTKVLAKIGKAFVAQTEAGWAAHLKERDWSEEDIQEVLEKRKLGGNCLFIFARVCKEWRKAQVEVGGRLRTRVRSDVLLPGQVELAKWALAEGCPREHPRNRDFTLRAAAAMHGHMQVVRWLIQEQGFAMDERVMTGAAFSGNLELVQWLRGENCPWDWMTCWNAVQQGHVEVLRWARENGCPWDPFAQHLAAEELGYTDDFGNLVDDHGNPVI